MFNFAKMSKEELETIITQAKNEIRLRWYEEAKLQAQEVIKNIIKLKELDPDAEISFFETDNYTINNFDGIYLSNEAYIPCPTNIEKE